MQHVVELRHDLRRHRGIMRGSVSLGLEQIAHPFRFDYAESLDDGEGNAWCLVAGDLVELLVDGELLTDGYVDRTSIRRDPKNYAFNVSGRAVTCDLVDCEVPDKPRTMTSIRLDALVRRFVTPFGFAVEVSGDVGAPISKFTVGRGEIVWDAIVRACRMRGFFPQYYPGTSRAIVLEKIDPTVGTTPLVLGENVLEAERVDDWTERFSEYLFRGRSKITDDAYGTAVKLRGVVRDPHVTRYRPKRLQIRGADGTDDVGRAAMRERNERAGKSETVTATVSGWRDYDGALWRPNTLVQVRAPELAIDGEPMLITECRYDWDEEMSGGFRTAITLKRREALDPDATYPAPFPRGIGVPA